MEVLLRRLGQVGQEGELLLQELEIAVGIEVVHICCSRRCRGAHPFHGECTKVGGIWEGVKGQADFIGYQKSSLNASGKHMCRKNERGGIIAWNETWSMCCLCGVFDYFYIIVN